jgi:hypothetical protein
VRKNDGFPTWRKNGRRSALFNYGWPFDRFVQNKTVSLDNGSRNELSVEINIALAQVSIRTRRGVWKPMQPRLVDDPDRRYPEVYDLYIRAGPVTKSPLVNFTE